MAYIAEGVLLNVAVWLFQWSRNKRVFKVSSEAQLWAMRQKRLKLQHLNLGFKVSEFKCLSLELRLQICHRRKVEKFVRFSELTMRRVEFNQGDGFDNPGFFFFQDRSISATSSIAFAAV